MRAILIDPHNREVRSAEDNFADFRIIKQYLGQGKSEQVDFSRRVPYPVVGEI